MNMRNILWVAAAATLTLGAALSANGATHRILLVGDSWAQLESLWGSFDHALAAKGLSQYTAKGNVTALGGSRAEQWVQPEYLQLITNELAANPTIDIVHISLGGNDFLRYVEWSLSRAQLDALYEVIVANIAVVVEHAKAQRPDVKVGVSSYDYLTRTQSGMTIQQVNEELVLFSAFLRDYADATDRCIYLNNWGLMQHTFGISGVYAPGELPAPGGPPNYTPFAGGDVSRFGVALADPIHLNQAGYQVLATNCIEQAYLAWLGFPAPTVLSFDAVTSPSYSPVLEYLVTFSEPVTGVDVSDFRVETTDAIFGARILSVSGSGAEYTVAVDRGMGNGTLTLILIDDDSIVGQRPLDGVGPGEYVGAAYTVDDPNLPLAA